MPVPNSIPARFHELRLRPSKQLFWLFWIANGLGLLAIFLSSAPWGLQLVVGTLQFVVGWRWWRRHLAQQGDDRVVGLRWRSGQFQLQLQGDLCWQTVELLPGSRCWSGWLVLYFKGCEGRRQLIVPADAGDAEPLRRLQVLLRYPPRALERASSDENWPG